MRQTLYFLLFLMAATATQAQNWNQIIKAAASDRGQGLVTDRTIGDQLGYSVAISGDYAIVGATGDDQNVLGQSNQSEAGSAYIFKQTAGVWELQQKIVASDRTASDNFGNSVAIHGDYAIVGADRESHDASGGSYFLDAGSAYIFKQTSGVWAQQQKIVPFGRTTGDRFGFSVAISGDYVIVGAFREDENASGGATLNDAGSAYFFKQTGGVWAQQQKIVASDRAADDNFGWSVAISGDYAIVGALGEDEDASGGATASAAGSAYIFKQTAGVWAQQQKIVASDRAATDFFGFSVAISGDYAIVGARSEDEDASGGATVSNAGSAYIFNLSGSTWAQQQKIVAGERAADDYFGYSVAISGDYAIVGAFVEDEDASGGNTATGAGSAYIFKQIAGVWAQQQKIVASDRAASDQFGLSVAISGDYALVGAFQEDEDASGGATLNAAGSAYIFTQTAGVWGQQNKVVTPLQWVVTATNDNFGYSVAINGDYAIVGAYQEDEDASGASLLSGAGSAYIFKKTAGLWAQQQKIVASDRAADDRFGYSVAISGDYAIVGAHLEDEDASGGATASGAGSAYIFKQTAGLWVQQQKIVASDRAGADLFGSSVAISGDYAIVGAYSEDQDASGGAPLSAAGSAYIFKQTGGVWAQQQKIVASDRAVDDNFGYSVSISGDYAIVGAYQEDENPSGGATATDAGSAYIFKQTGGVWAQQQKIVAADRATLDNFGYSVAIHGDYAIVGAYQEDQDASGGASLSAAGSAYIFQQTAGVWVQQQKIVAADRAATDFFGFSVAISGDHAIVGAYQEDHDANGGAAVTVAGSAYVFKQTAGVWAQQQKIVASDRAADDRFGYCVAISGKYAIVGAPFEDHDASGANMITNTGSAYIFYEDDKYTWLGTVQYPGFGPQTGNWSEPANWNTGTVPTAAAHAIIPDGAPRYPLITNPVTVNKLTVEGNATVSISYNNPPLSIGALTVNDSVINEGLIDVIGDGHAGFLQSDTCIYTGNGTFRVLLGNDQFNTADGYRNISSPVQGATVADIAAHVNVFGQNGVNCWYSYSPYPNVQVYDEALSIVSGNYYEGWKSYTGLSNPLSPMKGLAVRTYGQEHMNIFLTGKPNNGPKSIGITKTTSATTSQDGWNLTGNPYPSTILWSEVKNLNPGETDASYYVFHTTGEYTGNWGSHNGVTGTNGATNEIAPMQGFFVKATGNHTFNMNNTVRSINQSLYFKNTTQPYEIRLQLSGNGNSDEIVAYTDGTASWALMPHTMRRKWQPAAPFT
jgi:hypothetical protein